MDFEGRKSQRSEQEKTTIIHFRKSQGSRGRGKISRIDAKLSYEVLSPYEEKDKRQNTPREELWGSARTSPSPPLMVDFSRESLAASICPENPV
ncbi:uncharacterized protein PADG_02961 [Paracoccidioides brasiliensis Pb18]|uniref:Uncharacterized protein n=1 Tax=Paracoccidioides brasiliensis (strain Pb18) TaxID=502780 RepID=C1G706_PARBD|nr:uncharacterized protein PADG_02961 [Paracoccidioides brasiliensis Pb18]EEH46863.2 hypothetical protein PADG_02961 [Paracoccidioides brasiliensis Pb18]